MRARKNPISSDFFAPLARVWKESPVETGVAVGVGVALATGLLVYFAVQPSVAQQQALGTVYMGQGGSSTPLPGAQTSGPAAGSVPVAPSPTAEG